MDLWVSPMPQHTNARQQWSLHLASAVGLGFSLPASWALKELGMAKCLEPVGFGPGQATYQFAENVYISRSLCHPSACPLTHPHFSKAWSCLLLHENMVGFLPHLAFSQALYCSPDLGAAKSFNEEHSQASQRCSPGLSAVRWMEP